MTRTFESGPAIAPDGPLQDPPTIEERTMPTCLSKPPESSADDGIRFHLDLTRGEVLVSREKAGR
jgi:hypothetical protein